MAFIAIEEHWNTPELAAAWESRPAGRRDDSLAFNEMGDHRARLEDLGDGRIAHMDAQGIDIQVIALAPPATQGLPAADAVPLCRQANDLAAEAVRRHPSRLRAMATLPMADPGAAVGELERAAGLGLVGTMVYGRTGETPLDDPAYDDLFATAAALRQPVFIHPQIPPAAVRAASYSGIDPMTDLGLATFGWGWHLEAALAALRLIVRGTFDRHPGLQVILGHWGELLPFWQDRVDSLSRLPALELLHHEFGHAEPGPAAPHPGSDHHRPADLLHRLPLPAADPGGDQRLPVRVRQRPGPGQLHRRERPRPVPHRVGRPGHRVR
jgi:predicted TIM-barrel fold metal-dependent hydrolase